MEQNFTDLLEELGSLEFDTEFSEIEKSFTEVVFDAMMGRCPSCSRCKENN